MRIATLATALFAAAGLHAAEGVSFYDQVRPVLGRSCAGCHQAANKMSGLVLTDYASILKGGQKQGAALRPGAADESAIVQYVEGKLEPRMPLGGEPLPAAEIDLIRQWIKQGAADDTPAEARAPQIPSVAPVYTQPPAITGLAYSPDGKLLAVGGYHEILLQKADGSGIAARLLGRSGKIYTLEFSADGKRLVAVGGTAAKFGEVQVWDVETQKLERSILATNDTLFGGSLAPDAKRVVVGSSDNSVRMFDLDTGAEIFKASHHEDWVLDTAFGIDGKRVVTVGRDRAAKLADAADGAFRENVNLLRDMLYAVVRHPRRDYVLIGGEDRVPYLYMMDRPAALKIADDSTLVRKFEEQKGRIYALAFSPDGSRIAVGGMSSEIPIYETETGERVAACTVGEQGAFVVTFGPKGERLAAGGFDGKVRVCDPATGENVLELIPVPLEKGANSE